jgi:pSer/pThr/pTyr-binding forkhead associated (FHA) protein
VKCKRCGANLDLTAGDCPACGASVDLGRLTGILGVVCRACDAYNEPGARTCAACGKTLGPVEAPAPSATAPAPRPPPASPPQPAAPPRAPSASPPPARPIQPPGSAYPTLASPPGAPVVRSLAPAPGPGAATRFVPAVLRPSAGTPAAPGASRPAAAPTPAAPGAPRPASAPSPGAPIPLVAKCPRCGAEAGDGLFCSRCGQPLGPKGTQVMMKPIPSSRTATQTFAPVEPGRAKLVVDPGDGLDGATFRLDGERIEAGRSRGAVVFPDDPCLAPHHATFFYRAGSLHVRDEGSPGGVFLRLRGISVPLRPGDHFSVGNRLLRYAGQVPPAPTPPPDGTRRLGSPRPAAPAAVIEEWLEGGTGGRVFVRGGPAVTIGRGGCSVNLGDDPHVSPAHAEILLDANGNARLKDLGSSNGTYVKIPPHGERELHDGDRLRMGREVLRVGVA